MRKITPVEFRSSFVKAINAEQAGLIKQWARPLVDYTDFMRKVILPKVAINLELKSYGADYYTIDDIFYEDIDTEHFSKFSTYAKYIAIAVEHENEAQRSYEEMNKLQLINTPLKVLIVYSDKEDEIQNLLQGYVEIIRDADCFGDFSTLRRQLVIFGSTKSTKHWRFFQFEDSTMVELT